MRKGEILSLRWENANLERNFITVTAVEAKKRIRRIPINSELCKRFIKLNPTRNGNSFVLQNPMTGQPYRDFQRSWKTLLTTAGIDGPFGKLPKSQPTGSGRMHPFRFEMMSERTSSG
jgi:integrase